MILKIFRKIPKGAKALRLSNGGFEIVDASDFEWLKFHTFHWAKYRSAFYAFTYIHGNRVSLHALVMGERPRSGLHIDHANHDGLDCRRCNLRWATPRQNNLNYDRVGVTGFCGVTPHKSGKYQWYAMKKVRGLCDTAEEAAKARDAFLREHLPPADLLFVPMNFDELGRRVVVVRFDHGLPPYEPRVKSYGGRGVTLFTAPSGRQYLVTSFCHKRQKSVMYLPPDEGELALLIYDWWREAAGLPRVNFPDRKSVGRSLKL